MWLHCFCETQIICLHPQRRVSLLDVNFVIWTCLRGSECSPEFMTSRLTARADMFTKTTGVVQTQTLACLVFMSVSIVQDVRERTTHLLKKRSNKPKSVMLSTAKNRNVKAESEENCSNKSVFQRIPQSPLSATHLLNLLCCFQALSATLCWRQF